MPKYLLSSLLAALVVIELGVAGFLYTEKREEFSFFSKHEFAPSDTEGDAFMSDGVRIHYWFYERGTNTVTIFLHGGPGHGTSDFRGLGQAEAYADTFGSLLVFDQRGGGYSDNSMRIAPTLNYPRLTGDIDELREKIVPGRPVVIFGRSYGGLLAAEYANTDPLDVKGYILAAPGPFAANDDIYDEYRAALTDAVGEEKISEVAREDRTTVLALLDERGFRDDGPLAPPPGEDDELDVGTAMHDYAGYFTEDEYHLFTALADTPVLIVYGAYDTQVPPLSIDPIREYLPNATFVELQGSHAAAYTHEEEFFAAVKTFFASFE